MTKYYSFLYLIASLQFSLALYNDCYDPITCMQQIKSVANTIKEQIVELSDVQRQYQPSKQTDPDTSSHKRIIEIIKNLSDVTDKIVSTMSTQDSMNLQSVYLFKIGLYTARLPGVMQIRCTNFNCTEVCALSRKQNGYYEFILNPPHDISESLEYFHPMFTMSGSCCRSEVIISNGRTICKSNSTNTETSNGKSSLNEIVKLAPRTCPCDAKIFFHNDHLDCGPGSSEDCLVCMTSDSTYAKIPVRLGIPCRPIHGKKFVKV